MSTHSFDERWRRIQFPIMFSYQIYELLGKPDRRFGATMTLEGLDSRSIEFWNRDGKAYCCIFSNNGTLLGKQIDGKDDSRQLSPEERRIWDSEEREARIAEAQAKRQSLRQCLNCGIPLSRWDRLRGRRQHPGCIEFKDLQSPGN